MRFNLDDVTYPESLSFDAVRELVLWAEDKICFHRNGIHSTPEGTFLSLQADTSPKLIREIDGSRYYIYAVAFLDDTHVYIEKE